MGRKRRAEAELGAPNVDLRAVEMALNRGSEATRAIMERLEKQAKIAEDALRPHLDLIRRKGEELTQLEQLFDAQRPILEMLRQHEETAEKIARSVEPLRSLQAFSIDADLIRFLADDPDARAREHLEREVAEMKNTLLQVKQLLVMLLARFQLSDEYKDVVRKTVEQIDKSTVSYV